MLDFYYQRPACSAEAICYEKTFLDQINLWVQLRIKKANQNFISLKPTCILSFSFYMHPNTFICNYKTCFILKIVYVVDR